MKKYKCHKVVEAAKILNIRRESFSIVLLLDDSEHIEISHDSDLCDRVEVGGYFVKYADGYESFSPAKAFEEGYTEI